MATGSKEAMRLWTYIKQRKHIRIFVFVYAPHKMCVCERVYVCALAPALVRVHVCVRRVWGLTVREKRARESYIISV